MMSVLPSDPPDGQGVGEEEDCDHHAGRRGCDRRAGRRREGVPRAEAGSRQDRRHQRRGRRIRRRVPRAAGAGKEPVVNHVTFDLTEMAS